MENASCVPLAFLRCVIHSISHFIWLLSISSSPGWSLILLTSAPKSWQPESSQEKRKLLQWAENEGNKWVTLIHSSTQETSNYSWGHHSTQAPTPATPPVFLLLPLENPALKGWIFQIIPEVKIKSGLAVSIKFLHTVTQVANFFRDGKSGTKPPQCQSTKIFFKVEPAKFVMSALSSLSFCDLRAESFQISSPTEAVPISASLMCFYNK